jgi:hypothetical protein
MATTKSLHFWRSKTKENISGLDKLTHKKCRSCNSKSTNGPEIESTLPLEQEPSLSRTTHCLRRCIAISCVAVAPTGKLYAH